MQNDIENLLVEHFLVEFDEKIYKKAWKNSCKIFDTFHLWF